MDCLAWPDADKAPDSDPIDQIGHGTHVAGIVAGKNDWYITFRDYQMISAYLFRCLGIPEWLQKLQFSPTRFSRQM